MILAKIEMIDFNYIKVFLIEIWIKHDYATVDN